MHLSINVEDVMESTVEFTMSSSSAASMNFKNALAEDRDSILMVDATRGRGALRSRSVLVRITSLALLRSTASLILLRLSYDGYSTLWMVRIDVGSKTSRSAILLRFKID